MVKLVLTTMLLLSIAAVDCRKKYFWSDCPYDGEQAPDLPTSSDAWFTYLPTLGKMRLALRDPFYNELEYSASYVTLEFTSDCTWTIEYYTMTGEFMTMTGPISSISLIDGKEWQITLDDAKQHGSDACIFTTSGNDRDIRLFITEVTDTYVLAKAVVYCGWSCYEGRYLFLRSDVSSSDLDFDCLASDMTTQFDLNMLHFTGVMDTAAS